MAAPRERTRPLPVPKKGSGAEAAGAGMTLIIIAAVFAWAGIQLAGLLSPSLQIAGGLIGGLLGVFAAFTGTYIRYRDL